MTSVSELAESASRDVPLPAIGGDDASTVLASSCSGLGRWSPVNRTLCVAALMLASLSATACSSGTDQALSATLVLDPACRDGGSIDVDGARWILDQGSHVPLSWRQRSEVSGTLQLEANGVVFAAADGTRLRVTNGFRKLSCSLWD